MYPIVPVLCGCQIVGHPSSISETNANQKTLTIAYETFKTTRQGKGVSIIDGKLSACSFRFLCGYLYSRDKSEVKVSLNGARYPKLIGS